jgi:hypothetical protein
MTDRAQFEAMLEALINEDQETAKEIFHNIVVGKSREIYEELLESDFPGEEEEEEEMDVDSEEDDSEDDSEDDAEAPEFGDEEDDAEAPEFGDEEEGEGELEDRVLDLEDALEELKAEFDQLLSGEENEPEHADMFGDEGDEFGGDEFGAEPEDEFGADLGDDDAEVKEVHITHEFVRENDAEFEQFMEYVNKVALPKHGDNGIQNKSVVDNMKNDMGGTTANIAQNFSTTSGGTKGGLAKPSTQPQTGGNINVPGGNAGKTAFKTKQPGGFGDNKGNKVVGAGTGSPNSVSGVNNKSLTKRLGK